MKSQPKLGNEQRQALAEQAGKPVYVVDVNSQNQYVPMPAEQYQYVKALLETEEFDISETYAAQSEALQDVWDENSEVELLVQETGARGAMVTDPVEQRRILQQVTERMQNNPLPPGAPRFSRDELHERR